MLTAMLNQESGLRGYLLTGQTGFLAPYTTGHQEFERALAASAGGALDGVKERGLLAAQTSAARAWQLGAQNAIASSSTGHPNTSVEEQVSLKAMFDRFRRANALFHDAEVTQRDASLAIAGTIQVLIIIGLAALFGGLGYVFLERENRRAARARRQDKLAARKQSQFTTLLRVTRSENEAYDLLKRHLERTVPGSAVVVLNRNYSANRLEARTPIATDTPFSRELATAKPADCLAIRMAHAHERIEELADEELLVCELRRAYAPQTKGMPSLVGGEVIGSVLISLTAAFDDEQDQQVAVSVTQAAPVLANLRTLAMAEAQAATDALTGLSNSRALQDSRADHALYAAKSNGRNQVQSAEQATGAAPDSPQPPPHSPSSPGPRVQICATATAGTADTRRGARRPAECCQAARVRVTSGIEPRCLRLVLVVAVAVLVVDELPQTGVVRVAETDLSGGRRYARASDLDLHLRLGAQVEQPRRGHEDGEVTLGGHRVVVRRSPVQ